MRVLKEIRLQQTTEFASGIKYAKVFIKSDSHAALVDFLYSKGSNGEWIFDYDKYACLDRDERIDLEEWFIAQYLELIDQPEFCIEVKVKIPVTNRSYFDAVNEVNKRLDSIGVARERVFFNENDEK